MNKVEWRYALRFLKDFAERNGGMLLGSAVLSVLGAVRHYINIVLMGVLLDAVYEGARFETLVEYALLALGANMLLRILEACIREKYNQKNEYIK